MDWDRRRQQLTLLYAQTLTFQNFDVEIDDPLVSTDPTVIRQLDGRAERAFTEIGGAFERSESERGFIEPHRVCRYRSFLSFPFFFS